MTENNELNLVISDEENANMLSGRSFPNTLSQQGSPAAQFAQRIGGEIYVEGLPQDGITSSVLKESTPSYDKDYTSNNGLQGYYYGDNITGPKPTLESVSSSQTFNFESNQQPQLARKTTKQSYEEYNGEANPYRRDGYEENQSAPTLQNEDENRRYANRERPNQYNQDQYMQVQNGYGNDYQEYNDEEDQNNLYEVEERKAQSLRDSQLAGPVRYSKMTEEEAALAFENRKKELFSTYLKKGPGKSPGGRSRTPGNERENRHMSPEEPFGNVSPNTMMVIASDKSNQIQNQKKAKANSQDYNKTPNAKRRPSVEKKEVVTNKANPAKQRKDSPISRNKPQFIPQQQIKKQNSKQNLKDSTKRPHEDHPNTVNVGLKKPAIKNKADEQYGIYYSEENNYERDRKPTPDYDSNTGSGMYISSKGTFRTQEILHDIQNIEEEILRLESESSRNFDSRENYTRSEPREEDLYPQTAKFAAPIDPQGQRQKERQVNTKPRNSREKSRSTSLQRSNSLDKKGKDYPTNKTPKEERERLKIINDLNNERGMRHTDNSQISIKDQISQSYGALNEKEFDHHYDYLYERALVQKNSRKFLQERSREMRERQEMEECTFAPRIHTRPNFKIEDIVIRTRNWQLQRDQQIIMNEREKVRKELDQCTFYPNGMLERGRKLEFNSNDFYKKNIEWLKRKEAEEARKQNEIHKSQMLPERRRSRSSVSMSRLHDSQNVSYDKDAKPEQKSRLGRSASNKSMRSARSIEKTSSSKKRAESEKKNRNSYSKANAPDSAKERKSRKSEKPLESRQSVNQSLAENNDTHLQPEILESYAIIDGLQQMLHTKQKESQERIIQQKENVGKKLRTISMYQQPKLKKPERDLSNNLRSKLSPSRSQHQLFGKIPITSAGFDTNSLEDATQALTVRNNRYYLEERSQDRVNPRASRERSNSKDSRNKAITPRKSYEVNKSRREGSYAAAAQQAKVRRESPFKSKQSSKHFENSTISKHSYSEAMMSPFQSLMTSPLNFAPFASVHSQKSELNYVTKGLTSPSTQSLEKKYLSLLDQVSRVTKQLDQINTENNTLHKDISSIQRRQLNKSSLYS